MKSNVEKDITPRVKRYLDLAIDAVETGDVPKAVKGAFKRYAQGEDLGIKDISEIPSEAMAMYYIGFCAGAQLTLKSAKKDMLFLKQVLNESKNLEVN
tara:strand:+ start:152 stop:445 length:294 start_codon:yes stop_codon:yes gene_type:complete